MNRPLPLKRYVEFYSGAAFPQDEQGRQDGELPFIKVSDLACPDREITTAESTVDVATARRLGARPAPPGTVVFPKVGAALLTNRRRILGNTAVFDNNVMGFRPRPPSDPRWFYYWSTTLDMSELANPGALPSVTVGQVGRMTLSVPEERVQRAVADYLGSETARIDTLIDRKQRFIDLLLEKRTALITHAVTKGLDPDVEMKDSGAQWLGQVPAHWEVKPNKYLLRLHQRTVGETGADYVLLSLTLKGLIRREMDGTGKWPSSFDTYQSVKTGELVFCLFDVDETPRTVGLAQEPGMVTGAYTVAECLPGSVARYVYYLFLSFDSDKRLKPLYSGLRKVIRPDRFLAAKMPAPSVAEQRAIVQYLDEQTTKIDGLVDKTRRSIDLLREYRTALISAAVTGQIDIPGAEASEEVS